VAARGARAAADDAGSWVPFIGREATRPARVYGRVCGWALARAHARSGDAAMIAGYMGSSENL
jgi:hypothetical protein